MDPEATLKLAQRTDSDFWPCPHKLRAATVLWVLTVDATKGRFPLVTADGWRD